MVPLWTLFLVSAQCFFAGIIFAAITTGVQHLSVIPHEVGMIVLFFRPDCLAKAAIYTFGDLVLVVLATVKPEKGPFTLAALESFVSHFEFVLGVVMMGLVALTVRLLVVIDVSL